MDKWKDSELQKMKAGGNQNAREFFESQPDFKPSWSLQEKYNSRAAALLRDKVIFWNIYSAFLLDPDTSEFTMGYNLKQQNDLFLKIFGILGKVIV